MGSGGRRQKEGDTGPVDTRITLAQMRELLPPNEKYVDDYLIQLRDELYNLAELALDCYFAEKRTKEQDSTPS
jgi:hypothetical protein